MFVNSTLAAKVKRELSETLGGDFNDLHVYELIWCAEWERACGVLLGDKKRLRRAELIACACRLITKGDYANEQSN